VKAENLAYAFFLEQAGFAEQAAAAGEFLFAWLENEDDFAVDVIAQIVEDACGAEKVGGVGIVSAAVGRSLALRKEALFGLAAFLHGEGVDVGSEGHNTG
jgi:hypothetical protein